MAEMTVKQRINDVTIFVNQAIAQVNLAKNPTKERTDAHMTLEEEYCRIRSYYNECMYNALLGTKFEKVDDDNWKFTGNYPLPTEVEKIALIELANRFQDNVENVYMELIYGPDWAPANPDEDDDCSCFDLGQAYGCKIVRPKDLNTDSFLKTLAAGMKERLTSVDFIIIAGMAKDYRDQNGRFWARIAIGGAVIGLIGGAVGYFFLTREDTKAMSKASYDEVGEEVIIVVMDDEVPAARFFH